MELLGSVEHTPLLKEQLSQTLIDCAPWSQKDDSEARFIQLINNTVMSDAERLEARQLFLERFAFHRMTCEFIERLSDRTL